MNGPTVIWSMCASACLTLALIHLVIWLKSRTDPVHLLFALAAAAVAGVAVGELQIMLADTPEQFGVRMRWTHVPIFAAVVSIVWFVRFYFQAGRLWLAWGVCAVRTLALILNFAYEPNLNYSQITSVQKVHFMGDTVSVAQGVASPRTRVGESSSILLLVFVVDASINLWRRGGRVNRQRAAIVGGSVIFFVLVGAGHVALIHAGLLSVPYMISMAFLVPVAAMGYELGVDVVCTAGLARELESSRAELRENEQQMELATTAGELGLFRWDAARDDMWVSEQGRLLLGLNGARKIGLSNFLDALVPEDRDVIREAVQESIAAGTAYEREYRVRLADGATRWIAAFGRVESNGKASPAVMQGVFFDITRRKRAELEQIRHRNEVTHLSRVAQLGELSGSLAHELNQPLTAILSNAQAAQEFLDRTPVDLDEVRAILKDIVDQDRRAGEVIRRLRLLFRKGEVQSEPLDLNELVAEVLKLMRGDLVSHGVMVRSKLAEGLPAIKGDRVQLQQVLINLILNASEAMSGDETTSRELSVLTKPDGADGVLVCVADKGSGIPADELERIFEPFFTTKSRGMGLGLAVCRSIIAAHAGQLWATQNQDRGACFHIHLSTRRA